MNDPADRASHMACDYTRGIRSIYISDMASSILRSDFFVFFSSQKLLVFCSFFSNDTRALTYISAANWEAGVWSDDSLLEDAQQWVMRFSLRPMEMLASLGQYSRETEREKTENKREPQRTKDPKFKSLILHSLCQCCSLFFVSLTFTLCRSTRVLSVVMLPWPF